MANLKFNVDVSAIAEAFKDLKMEIESDLQKAVGSLAAMTHAKTLEKAQQELKSTRERYTNALTFEEVSPGVWVVSLDESAVWIEDGMPEHDMKESLLKNAKTGKNGVRYKVIPFNYSRPSSTNTVYAQNVVNNIKQNLKQQGIAFKKIEKLPNGSPRVGKIHSDLDFGGEKPGKGNTPVMKGINIYQNKTPGGSVRRDIMTFRTVSDGPGSEGKWQHPGLEPKEFMDRALAECIELWENQILPEILAKYK